MPACLPAFGAAPWLAAGTNITRLMYRLACLWWMILVPPADLSHARVAGRLTQAMPTDARLTSRAMLAARLSDVLLT